MADDMDSSVMVEDSQPEDIESANKEESLLLEKYFDLKRLGTIAYRDLVPILLGLTKKMRTTSSPQLLNEISCYTSALLGSKNSSLFYLQVLAALPDDQLQELVIHLIRSENQAHPIQVRCALLFSLIKIFPTSLNTFAVLELIVQTCHGLLDESTRNSSAYCNKFREVFAMKFLPLLMSSSLTEEALAFYLNVIPEFVKFCLAAVLTTVPQDEAVPTHPDGILDSLLQVLSEVCRLSHPELSLELWDHRRPSIVSLNVWWDNMIKWRTMVSPTGDLDFYLIIAFWGVLLCRYVDVKNQTEIPERRPFFVKTRLEPCSQADPAGSHIAASLADLFKLILKVWITLQDQENPRFPALFITLINQLQLEELSAVYATVRCDLDTVMQIPLHISTISDVHPNWLKTQVMVQHVCSVLKLSGLSPPLLDEICKVSCKLLLSGVSSKVPPHRMSCGGSVLLVWDDRDILEYFCNILLDGLNTERASDDMISVVLVLLQPVLAHHLMLLENVITTIESKGKFTFKQFFRYIVLPDVIAEFSGLVGRVAMELTPEPLPGLVSVHKTRGANRESTDALQIELQRHAVNPALMNPYRAVQAFLKSEKELLGHTLFLHPSSSSQRRK